jgi:hypothetical protein
LENHPAKNGSCVFPNVFRQPAFAGVWLLPRHLSAQIQTETSLPAAGLSGFDMAAIA